MIHQVAISIPKIVCLAAGSGRDHGVYGVVPSGTSRLRCATMRDNSEAQLEFNHHSYP